MQLASTARARDQPLGRGRGGVLNGAMTITTEIAIVGGGMNGLCAALALAREGFAVALAERGTPLAYSASM